MIGEDINERMARFAPSQGASGVPSASPAALDAIDELRGATGPQQGVPSMPSSAALKAIDELRRQDDTVLKATMLGARGVNPDQAARAKAVGTEAGVGADIALRNMDELERAAFMKRLDAMNLARNDPSLARFLQDSDMAAMSWDDIDNLRETKGIFEGWGAPEAFDAGLRQSRTMRQAARLRERGNITPEEIAQIDEWMMSAEGRYEESGGGFVPGSSRIVGQMYEPFKEAAAAGSVTGSLYAGYAMATESIPPQLAAGAGFTAGFTGSMVRSSFDELSGYAYYNMRKKGVSEGPAQFWSGVAGVANASLEMIGMVPVFGDMTEAVGKMVVNETIEQVTKRSMGSIAMTAVKKSAVEVGVETATEVTQTWNDAVTLTAAQLFDGNRNAMLLTEQGWRELVKEAVETAIQTAQGMVLLSIPGPAASFTIDAARMRKAKQFAAKLDKAIDNAARSRLRQRDPAAYKALVEGRAQGTPANDLYLEARKVDLELRQMGLDPRSLDGLVPGFSKRLEEALATNGDVRMTAGEFLSQMATEDAGRALVRHIRVGDPDAMSQAEAEAAQAQAKETIAKMREAADGTTNASKDFVESANRVEDSIAKMLADTGMFTREEQRYFTDMALSFVVTNAPRARKLDESGKPVPMTPEEFFERFKNQILGPQVMQAQPPAATGRQRIEIAPGVAAPQRPAGMTDAAYERMILDEFEAPQLPETDAGQLQAQNDVALSAIENSSIADKAKRGLLISVNDVTSALKRQNVVDLANALWKLRQRLSELETVPAELQALAASIEQKLASLGITIEAPQVGADHRGETELGIITSFPNKDSEQVFDRIKNVQAPVVRRNGSVISRAQVTVEEGATAFEDQRIEAFEAEKKRLTDEVQDRMARVRQAVSDSRIEAPPAQVLEQRPVAPDSGVFDANNPPAPLADGQPIFAVLTSDGEVLYDREATMHGDLAEKFPDKADLIIDGGFIVNGQYQMGQSQGGWSAYEGEPDQVTLAEQLAAKANERKPQTITPAPQRGPIEAAKALVQDASKEAYTDADDFFKKRWASLLKKTGRTVKPTASNFREAARRAVADILEFVANNPKFADYYEKDWALTRRILDDFVGRPITDDEFLMFRAIAGLTSPNTMLPSNISDTVGLWNYWLKNGNFNEFTLGPKPGTGALVVFTAPEPISGTTANIKVRTIQIIEQLVKEKGSVKAALDFLQEGVSVTELHKFNRKMGYSGNVSNIGNIRSLVKQATGQDKLIPRMFIYGQKVGAYTLNAIGDSRYTTVDIWESRYIRSHFTGMFSSNIGLPESTREHEIFTRFGYLFKEEMEKVTGRKWAPSALQALRWFYIIETARKAGYSKASTNETISFYTERRLGQAFGYRGLDSGGGQPGAGSVAGGAEAGQVQGARIAPEPFDRDLERDIKDISDPDERRRYVQASYVGYARHNAERQRVDFRFDERRLRDPRQHGVLSGAQVVAEFVPGDQMVEAYRKAGLPTPAILELGNDVASAQAFRDLVVATNQSNPHGAAVYAYTAEEYATKRLFVTEDGKGGFAVTPDGDIVSVFSAHKSGNGRSLMALAVQAGGIRLDCFDTNLPGYYSAHGFVAVARLPWNDAFAPEGWDSRTFAKYNGGKPDVVFMVYQRYSNRAYKGPEPAVDDKKAKTGDGKKVTSYEAGVQAQAKELAKQRAYQQVPMPGDPNQEPQGTFEPGTFITRINKNGNITTLIHESSHYWLEVMGRLAADANAPADIVQDFDTILQWFGIEGATAAERSARWNAMTLEQKRPHHESFARNMEIWTFEGKAPSVELQPAFERFRRWLKQFYVALRDRFNEQYKAQFGTDMPVLSPEVRGVFERMFADDEQIARARAIRDAMGLFNIRPEGMSDAEWAAYQQMAQEEDMAASADFRRKSLAQMKWLRRAQEGLLREMQKETDERRAEVRAEVEREVREQRVYRAIDFLRTGTIRNVQGEDLAVDNHRLDIDAVTQMYALEPEALRPDLKRLGTGAYGILGKGGMDPNVAAEMLGYASADQMVRDILDAKPVEEAIETETDRRMLAESGELDTPEKRREAVDAALHTEATARRIAVELRFMSKAVQPVRVMMQAARQVAKTIIGGKKIREIRPREYISAESRAAKDAREAYGSMPDPERAGQAAFTKSMNEQASAIAAGMPVSDAQAIAEQARQDAVQRAKERIEAYRQKYPAQDPTVIAIAAKRQEMLNHELAAESIAAREEVDKAIVGFRRMFKPDDKVAKARNMDKVNAARAILGAFGLGRKDKAAAAYIGQIEKYDPKLYAELKPILDAATANAVDWRDLTLDEFRGVRDAVEALWYSAQRDREIHIAGQAVLLETAVFELNRRFEQIGIPDVVAGDRRGFVWVDKARDELINMRAHLRMTESWAEAMDAQDPQGPFTKYIWRPVRMAVDAYVKDKNKYLKKFVDLKSKLKLPVGMIVSDETELNYTFGAGNGGVGKAEVLGAMMHMGNESNLRKLLIGRGWGDVDPDGNLDTRRWDAFVSRMFAEGVITKEDMDFLQAVWDLNEEIKPLAQRAHRQVFGFYFREIEARPVVTPYGTYRGGYVPAARDIRMVPKAAQRAAMEELEADFRQMMPSTGSGFAISRVESNEPLTLDLSMLGSHIDAVLRFAHIQPAVKDVLKILKNDDFASSLNRIDKSAIKDMLIPWLNRTARQTMTEAGKSPFADRMWRGVRKRAGLNIMFASMSNALQQGTGIFIGMTKVKPSHMGHALVTYMRNPLATADMVAGMSDFMDDRMRSQIFQLQSDINELRDRPTKYGQLQQWVTRHGYFAQQAVQNIVDVTVWIGAYNQSLAEAKAGMPQDKAHSEAVQRANAVVRLTQGSLRPEDVASFAVGTPFYQSFVQFMNWGNMLANLNATEYTVIFRDLGWRSSKGRIAYIYLMAYAAPMVVADAIAKTLRGQWDDEDDDGYLDEVIDTLFGSQLRGPVGMIPFGSAIYSGIAGGFTDRYYDDKITASPSITTLESAFIGSAKAAKAAWDPDKEVSGKNIRDVLSLMSLLTGLPVQAIGRPVTYLKDVADGKVEPTGPIDFVRGLLTGVASEASKER